MNRYLFIILICIALISCQRHSDGIEIENGKPLEPQTYQIELSQQIIEVGFDTNTYSIGINSSCTWVAESLNEWISVKTECGTTNTKELTFVVECNENNNSREGAISIINSTYNIVTELQVVQNSFVPEINLSPETLSFAYSGGTQHVSIDANFKYEIYEECEWISYEDTEGGINVFVEISKSMTNRTGEIFITNNKYDIQKVVKIEQSCFIPQITINPESLIFSLQGGAQEINIEANFQYEITSNKDWLLLSPTEKGLIATVPAYSEAHKREAKITISNEEYNILKEINVSQSALNVLIYTSCDDNTITPNTANNPFGVNIVSNIYEKGVGVIAFDGDLTSIGTHAFMDSKRLTSIIIPEGVSSIGNRAFKGCENLTSVIIPNNVSLIEYWAFAESSIKEIILPNKLTEIKGCLFYGCNNLEEIIIPNSVSKIGDSAFENCKNLKNIIIPSGVHSIERCAFRFCENLTSASICDGTTSIGERAFEGCLSLTRVSIPNSITEINSLAFNNCPLLSRVDIQDLSSWCKIAFKDYTMSNPLYNKAELFVAGEKLINLIIPSDIQILKFATFSGCQSITNIIIPNNVIKIGQNTFSNCDNLTKLVVGDNVKYIRSYAFRSCDNLQDVTIGENVEEIDYTVFADCTQLKTVYCKPIIPPAICHDTFPFNTEMKIYVPRNSYYSYTQYSQSVTGTQQANWCEYNSYIEPFDF